MASREVELKLRMTAAADGILRRDPVIHRNKLGRARSRSLFAVYFDTPDLALRSAGTALRIRQEGGGRVQTFKAKPSDGEPGGGVGLQTRIEIEVPTHRTTPDLALIANDEARRKVETLVGEKPLEPVFTTDFKRTLWDIAIGDSVIELALDRGAIRSGKREAQIHEAELELKSGQAKDILVLAKLLLQRVDFRVMGESKATRGYRLFTNETQVPVKAVDAPVEPTDTAWQALVAMLGETTGQMFANEAIVLDGRDPEGVHQARIAVRRARALLSAFRPVLRKKARRRLAKRLGWMQAALGPARDWDVFLDETLDPLIAEHPDNAALKAFRKKACRARTDAYDQARAAIHSRDYAKLQLALIGFAFTTHPAAQKTPARTFAHDLLLERVAAVRRLAGDDPRSLPETDQHALRLELKKLRYAAEFFRPLHGRTSKPLISTTKKLQDCLGALNDAVVARGLVESLATAGRPIDTKVALLIDETFSARVAAGLEDLNGLWAKFRRLEPYWDAVP